ncbi:hypothetical protein [Phycicoccus sp. Soil748]|uniref:hypothetical protein n=1 Tax=Phycicoccus sp. Soil748 TaxID=1736397 RepID=UPI000702D183|nr:hypothetical protein [Phycicoccus sp. Soil748]KRE57221.1 hypothetical protein ASG70_02055 [Phycicoccus sp. Soil748]
MTLSAPRHVIAGALAGALALGVAGCGAGASLVGVGDAPAQVTTAAPIGRDAAQKVAERVLSQAAAAQAAPATQAQRLRTASLTGSALAVADAAAKLGSTAASPTTAPLTRTDPPKVLAVSRGTDWPRVILVQTTSGEGAAVLNLLTSPDAATPFRLSSSVTMQPGTEVAALDPLDEGSPRVTAATKLAVQPDELLTEYAASLAYPKPTPAKAVATNDPFSTAVRANAAAQAKAFGTLATLQQKHTVHPVQTVSLALRGGGALVFSLLERTDTITLKPGGKSLTPSAEFQRLVGKKALSRNAVLRSYETVAFTVPAEGKASVVGADEVLFSAKGS